MQQYPGDQQRNIIVIEYCQGFPNIAPVSRMQRSHYCMRILSKLPQYYPSIQDINNVKLLSANIAKASPILPQYPGYKEGHIIVFGNCLIYYSYVSDFPKISQMSVMSAQSPYCLPTLNQHRNHITICHDCPQQHCHNVSDNNTTALSTANIEIIFIMNHNCKSNI